MAEVGKHNSQRHVISLRPSARCALAGSQTVCCALPNALWVRQRANLLAVLLWWGGAPALSVLFSPNTRDCAVLGAMMMHYAFSS